MSTGMILIIIGGAGALIMVLLFSLFIRQVGRKRFENFNASISYRQFQANQFVKEPNIAGKIIFCESRKWHEGKGVPGAVRSVNSVSLYENSSKYGNSSKYSEDLEVTEKL